MELDVAAGPVGSEEVTRAEEGLYVPYAQDCALVMAVLRHSNTGAPGVVETLPAAPVIGAYGCEARNGPMCVR